MNRSIFFTSNFRFSHNEISFSVSQSSRPKFTKAPFSLLQIIAKKNGLKWETVKRLGELQDALGGLGLDEMISLVNQILHTEPYSKEEIVAELETTSEHLDEISLTSNTKHIREFKLRARALHVFQGKSA